jgi:hypothetical protein
MYGSGSRNACLAAEGKDYSWNEGQPRSCCNLAGGSLPSEYCRPRVKVDCLWRSQRTGGYESSEKRRIFAFERKYCARETLAKRECSTTQEGRRNGYHHVIYVEGFPVSLENISSIIARLDCTPRLC